MTNRFPFEVVMIWADGCTETYRYETAAKAWNAGRVVAATENELENFYVRPAIVKENTMIFEVRAYWIRNDWSAGVLDKKCSEGPHEITEEAAAMYMNLIEANGGKRHETATQIFYDKRVDSNTVIEYIFYK